jgi:uncharacterized protein YbjT (DUF2867 family)
VILVAGATGTIGRSLVHALTARSDIHTVRALARRPARWADDKVEMTVADVYERDSLRTVLRNVRVAYYLVHGLERPGFAVRDVDAARGFALAAAAAGVERLIFLGAMSGGHSAHLLARYAVGDTLRDAGVPVIELGAAAVIGAGSPVFELVRHLVERMPVVPCPHGCHTRTQPIAMADAIAYLLAALDAPASAGQRVDIGGPAAITWRQMMVLYAQMAGLRRRFVDLPLAVRELSATWIGLLSPVPRDMARQLVHGMPCELVVSDDAARRYFPQIRPMAVREALAAAIQVAAPLTPAPWSGISALASAVARL